jgi:hypothetical protein
MGTKFLFLGRLSGSLTLVEGYKDWELSIVEFCYGEWKGEE